uniref:Uncharacterized protein n=1 Tax=Rhizophora mucronata TaxID=61149 RepID=A0A2P2QN14_RHIMU
MPYSKWIGRIIKYHSIIVDMHIIFFGSFELRFELQFLELRVQLLYHQTTWLMVVDMHL